MSKNNVWFLHLEVSGGEPGEYVDINSIATFPTGSTYQAPLVGVWDGFTGTSYYWYDNPAYGYTGTFTVDFYDSDGNLIDSLSVELTN